MKLFIMPAVSFINIERHLQNDPMSYKIVMHCLYTVLNAFNKD